MQISKRHLSATALGCLLMIGGCSEQASVQMHEPGEYKGAPDPLLDIAGTPEQEVRLKQRLLAVQTDR